MDAATFPEDVVQVLREEGLLNPRDPETPVVRFAYPAQLQEEIDFSLGQNGCTDEELLSLVRHTIRRSVDTGHPHFYNQLYGGTDPYGLAGAWVSEACNTNQYTFEVAPTFSLAEHAVLQRALELFGFPNGDGIFAPGGSMSNMYGLVLARYRMFPDVKLDGLAGLPPLVVFTSEDAHYSTLKGAHWLGIGTRNVVKVKTDAAGCMDPKHLEQCIIKATREKKKPFAVVATAGTTVLGSFDPLNPLADICQKHGLWLHVDACWGGSLILSRKHASVLEGIDRVDSVSWNPHKMVGAPLQCSMFLVKHEGLLHRSNSASATYLFQQDKFYDVTYDSGDKSVQCGRKVDAYKLWLMWRKRGDEGLSRLVDNAVDCAQYFAKIISERPGFELVLPEFQCTNICFWFIPSSMRDQTRDEAWWDKLAKVAPLMKERMVLQGAVMLGYQPMAHRGMVNFFRMVTTCQPPPTRAQMDFVIEEIERLGDDL
ncbi:cysteine sulfinic acid decarboxylase-like [Cloeon dipterum]|uniref:cysteine sulfinic acid decarboxylase-like n=1 Tax=Cloeon dipterum TaxID=197152 RepID=UPI00321FAAEA